jgi:hypothetical protein
LLGTGKPTQAIKGDSQIVEGLHKFWIDPNGPVITVAAFLKQAPLSQDCSERLPCARIIGVKPDGQAGRNFGRFRLTLAIEHLSMVAMPHCGRRGISARARHEI